MSDIIISVENLGKCYQIDHEQQQGYTALRDVIANKAKNIFKSSSSKKEFQKTEDFWAVKDVSFEVKQGDAVGIIGRNGAGKSTLLKLLSRITEPTKGRITLNGRVASLLEVGTGFHPELSGRENIYLNGAILGMSRREIKAKFDEIVDFSGVEKFLDTPVKRYSSGMYVRLAFAVAAHLEPEILIVDEVLAVGDAEFQKKCLGKMEDVSKKEGRTVLFVSHNMAAITALCNKAVLLKSGQVQAMDSTPVIIDEYIRGGQGNQAEVRGADIVVKRANSKARFYALRMLSAINGITSNFNINEEVIVEIEFEVTAPETKMHVSIHLLDNLENCVFATFNAPSASLIYDPYFNTPIKKGRYKSTCVIPAFFLNDNIYKINAFLVSEDATDIGAAEQVLSFSVHETGEMRKEYVGDWIGAIRPKFAWKTEQMLG